MNSASVGNSRGIRQRILVVDGHDVMAEALRMNGYDVERAAPEEALQLALLVRWNGVVLDLDLPGLNGIELYARMLRGTGTDRLPVLFVSGRPHEALRFGLQGTPWARLLHKPCGLHPLLAALAQCLRTNDEATSASGG